MDNSAWKCYCDRLKFSLRIGTFFPRNVPSGDEQEKTAVLAGYLKLFEPRSCFQFSKINEYSYFTHACTKPTKFQPTRFCKTTLHLKLLVLWKWTTCGHWDFRTCACLVKACFKISYVVVLVFGAIFPPPPPPPPTANGRNIVGCYLLRPFAHPHPVACCSAKIETGQTFESTTPNISFVPWPPRRSVTMFDCSRLRDSGEKSFGKRKCEKRAGEPSFPSRARLIFALLVLIRPHYTIW